MTIFVYFLVCICQLSDNQVQKQNHIYHDKWVEIDSTQKVVYGMFQKLEVVIANWCSEKSVDCCLKLWKLRYVLEKNYAYDSINEQYRDVEEKEGQKLSE